MFCPVNERDALSTVFWVFCENLVAPRPGLGRVKVGSTASFGLFSLSSSVVRASNMVVPVSFMLNGTLDHMWASVWERTCVPWRGWGFSQAIALEPVTWLLGTQTKSVRRWQFTCLKKKKAYVARYHRHALCFWLASSATIPFFVVKILTLSLNRVLIKNEQPVTNTLRVVLVCVRFCLLLQWIGFP